MSHPAAYLAGVDLWYNILVGLAIVANVLIGYVAVRALWERDSRAWSDGGRKSR
jgi:hypothetical protein